MFEQIDEVQKAFLLGETESLSLLKERLAGPDEDIVFGRLFDQPAVELRLEVTDQQS